MANLRPYLFFFDFFAKFDEHGRSHRVPNWTQWRGLFSVQYGITSRINTSVIGRYFTNHQSGQRASHFGDTTVTLNFSIFKEGQYTPGLLFAIQETFPTGCYRQLSRQKSVIDGTGTGAFQTAFTLNVGKVVWWWFDNHPMDFRLSLNYQVSSRAPIKGISVYGGAEDTKGKAHPGDLFALDIGYQYSFTQRCAFALDIVYVLNLEATFSGRRGTDRGGRPAKVGLPFNDNLSFLPAIEYNWSPRLGITTGIWFSPWGRNSLQFASSVSSLTYTW